jgi:molecular chaperone GrpE (heat shock protein)
MADEAQTAAPLATMPASSTPEDDNSTAAIDNESALPEPGSVENSQYVSSADAAQVSSQALECEQETSSVRLAEMHEALMALRRDFESKLMYDAGKQRQLDILHEELETYRRGFHLQLLRPMITDLIALYSDMDKVVARLTSQSGHADAVDEIEHFRAQIEEILRRNGIERYTSHADMFDAGRQRVVSTIETSDPANDKRIAERIRSGFEYEGKIVVQVEQVKTYRYVPSVETAEQA